jgi:P4 family phage/plasmid primase-like protien
MLLHLKSEVTVPDNVDMPCWVDYSQPNLAWAVPNIFTFQNQSSQLDEMVTDEWYQHSPATPQLFTDLSVDYGMQPLRLAGCPRWRTFLNEALPDPELQQLLQMWFGYCLVMDNRYHRFMILHGPTATGKSTAANVLKALLGDKSVSHVTLSAFKEQFALQNTLGKKLNLDADMAHVDYVAEEALRSWVGGDGRLIDRKYKHGLSLTPKARLMFCTNKLPRIRDLSDATYRRMLLLPFTVQVPPDRRNPHLLDNLREDLPGIWWWAYDGLLLLREKGDFPIPASMTRAIAAYKEEQNPALEWFNLHCALDPQASIPTQEAYNHFREWADSRGVTRIPSSTAFGVALHDFFPGRLTRKQVRIPAYEGGGRHYVYYGFKLGGRPPRVIPLEPPGDHGSNDIQFPPHAPESNVL